MNGRKDRIKSAPR